VIKQKGTAAHLWEIPFHCCAILVGCIASFGDTHQETMFLALKSSLQRVMREARKGRKKEVVCPREDEGMAVILGQLSVAMAQLEPPAALDSAMQQLRHWFLA